MCIRLIPLTLKSHSRLWVHVLRIRNDSHVVALSMKMFYKIVEPQRGTIRDRLCFIIGQAGRMNEIVCQHKANNNAGGLWD